MSRKILLFHALLCKKTTNHFSHFSNSNQNFTQQKSTLFSKFRWDYHSIIQNQPYSKIREEYQQLTHVRIVCQILFIVNKHPPSPISTDHKNSEQNSYNENDSRSWRCWYHGNDLTTEEKEIYSKRVYSKISCDILYIWSLVCYNKCNFLEYNLGYIVFGGLGIVLSKIFTF